MSEKETATLPRPTRLFFEKREEPARAVEAPAVVLDMGEASRLEGFRLNGCR